MGLYDREYASDSQYGAPRQQLTTLVKIIIVTGVAFLGDILTNNGSGVGLLTQYLELFPDWFMRPWTAYQLLTYGFVHGSVMHILLNMFVLWMFGRLLQDTIGEREFLWFYLVSIVAAGMFWSLTAYGAHVLRDVPLAPVVGASGGVSAIVLATILRYPREKLFLMGIIEMPFWVFGCIFIGMDVFRAIVNPDGGVAYTAHLGGAGFAALYHFSGFKFERWIDVSQIKSMFKRKPKLRVIRDAEPDNLEKEADRILQKIHEQGQDSLTKREVKLMEKYRRKINEKRRQDPF